MTKSGSRWRSCLCIQWLAIVYIMSLLMSSIFLAHLISIFIYFKGRPPFPGIETAHNLQIAAEVFSIIAISVALIVLLGGKCCSLVIVIILGVLMGIAIILHACAIAQLGDVKMDEVQLSDLNRKAFAKNESSPFLKTLEIKMKGLCCGFRSYHEYDAQKNDYSIDVPRSCCYALVRKDHKCGRKLDRGVYEYYLKHSRLVILRLEHKYKFLNDLLQAQEDVRTMELGPPSGSYADAFFPMGCLDMIDRIQRSSWPGYDPLRRTVSRFAHIFVGAIPLTVLRLVLVVLSLLVLIMDCLAWKKMDWASYGYTLHVKKKQIQERLKRSRKKSLFCCCSCCKPNERARDHSEMEPLNACAEPEAGEADYEAIYYEADVESPPEKACKWCRSKKSKKEKSKTEKRKKRSPDPMRPCACYGPIDSDAYMSDTNVFKTEKSMKTDTKAKKSNWKQRVAKCRHKILACSAMLEKFNKIRERRKNMESQQPTPTRKPRYILVCSDKETSKTLIPRRPCQEVAKPQTSTKGNQRTVCKERSSSGHVKAMKNKFESGTLVQACTSATPTDSDATTVYKQAGKR